MAASIRSTCTKVPASNMVGGATARLPAIKMAAPPAVFDGRLPAAMMGVAGSDPRSCARCLPGFRPLVSAACSSWRFPPPPGPGSAPTTATSTATRRWPASSSDSCPSFRSFTETMSSLRSGSRHQTRLSSAGLVYFHFGNRVLAQSLGMELSDPALPTLLDKVYENFVEEIDAIDNGIPHCDGESRYVINTHLSARVANLNPLWNAAPQDPEAAFAMAMELVGGEFLDRLNYYHTSWLPARGLVKEAIQERREEDESGEIMVLKQGGCPWKEHLFELEKELKIEPPIKFILYMDLQGHWRVQCVPETPKSFRSRLPLPEDWRGLRDTDLSTRSRIAGCVFVHATGFIGGNISKEGALQMARNTLTQAGKVEGL
ncbi:MYG1 exonuclease isoform X1 [Narcine bancroftii]|uniref:MYG1 exonuclease isoform X1 n=1 Tax=Narcine bancroftii TaxID=1343680 RepID=UPI0038321EC8